MIDFSENLKNLTVRSGKQRTLLPEHKEDRNEEKMDTTEDDNLHPTSQSKYIKQAKNATSKANAEKIALNAIREKLELDRMRDEHGEKYTEETSRKERSRTPGKSASTRKSQKSASNRNNSDSVCYDNDNQYGKTYVDVSNRHGNTQYSSTFSDFRGANLVEGKQQGSPEYNMDTADNRNEVFDNEVGMDDTPSESKYIKRKHSSKVVPDNKLKTKSKSPEPIVLTPRDPAPSTRTNTYTVNLEAPYNVELENGHRAADSPPERRKVSRAV